MAQYYFNGVYILDETNTIIPQQEGNSLYTTYINWLNLPNTEVLPTTNKPSIQLQDEAIAKNTTDQQAILERNAQSATTANAQQAAQKYTAPNDQLANQALYPLWSGASIPYTLNQLVQAFNASNVLTLYKCVQAHTSQATWTPPSVPALFTVVAPSGTVLAWVQPTGAQDAYPIGAKVTYSGFTWKSGISANTTKPEVTVFNYWQKQ